MPPPEPQHPTIDAVAALAGVSTATVSRTLNKPDAVREPLRRKVEAAIARLGYVPHAGARALMLRRSGTVGAVFPTVDNAIFAKAIGALQRRLGESDTQLLIATSDYDVEREMRQAMNLVTRGVDALALCGLCQHPKLLKFLRRRGLPSVHVMVEGPADDTVCVGFDNAAATAQATRHLIALGHRRIAMLAGICANNDRAAARVAGVRSALRAARIAFPPHRLLERRYAIADARDGLHELMRHRPAPTAIICGNDVLAFGAMIEAQRMGLIVPRDLSVVGFDDLELARHVQPTLTTVAVPTEAMWTIAAERMLAALRGETVPPSTRIDVALLVRESTAPPPER